jgi:small subunit ribosomal protein S21
LDDADRKDNHPVRGQGAFAATGFVSSLLAGLLRQGASLLLAGSQIFRPTNFSDASLSDLLPKIPALIQQGVNHLQVFVRDNNIDQALRALKRKMQRDGVFREMKRRRFYEKPSDRATRERAESERRRRKRVRKQAILDGLIAAPRTKRTRLGVRPASSPAMPSRVNNPR